MRLARRLQSTDLVEHSLAVVVVVGVVALNVDDAVAVGVVVLDVDVVVGVGDEVIVHVAVNEVVENGKEAHVDRPRRTLASMSFCWNRAGHFSRRAEVKCTCRSCPDLGQVLIRGCADLGQVLIRGCADLGQALIRVCSDLPQVLTRACSDLGQGLVRPCSDLPQVLISFCSDLLQVLITVCCFGSRAWTAWEQGLPQV